MSELQEVMLKVNNLEVIYDLIILILKGTSLEVPKGGIVVLLVQMVLGKTVTLKTSSNQLEAKL